MEFFDHAWPFSDKSDGVFTQKTAAERNRIRILGLLACRVCKSQRQIAALTGLQASTVSNIVRELKNSSIIREGQAIEADRVGPKETELEIVDHFTWAAGVSLDPQGYRVMLVNALGHVLAKHHLPPGISLEQLPDELAKAIPECAKRAGLAPSKVGGVGISVPGAVNSETGEILVSRSLGLSRVPLRDSLQTALNCPVWVERNVACGAYAESQIGAAIGRESFIYFLLRSEPNQPEIFGLSLVVGEKIFHGCNSAAGEVDQNILAACFAHLDENGRPKPGSLDAFYESYARGLAGIINLLDVGCLILCSNDDNLTQSRFDHINNILQGSLVPIPDRRFHLIRSDIGIDGMLHGAALLALHRSLAAHITPKKIR